MKLSPLTLRSTKVSSQESKVRRPRDSLTLIFSNFEKFHQRRDEE